MPRKTKAAILEELDEFTRGYLSAALWTEDPVPGTGEYEADLMRLSRPSLRKGAAECKAFQDKYSADLEEFGRPDDHAGHDFWLTRNGHGTGFWDKGAGAVGDRLTKAAEEAGEVYTEWWRGVLWLDWVRGEK